MKQYELIHTNRFEFGNESIKDISKEFGIDKKDIALISEKKFLIYTTKYKYKLIDKRLNEEDIEDEYY